MMNNHFIVSKNYVQQTSPFTGLPSGFSFFTGQLEPVGWNLLRYLETEQNHEADSGMPQPNNTIFKGQTIYKT